MTVTSGCCYCHSALVVYHLFPLMRKLDVDVVVAISSSAASAAASLVTAVAAAAAVSVQQLLLPGLMLLTMQRRTPTVTAESCLRRRQK